MGCGSSTRLNFCNHGSTVPPNVRPLLQQRFDNIKKRLQSRGRAHPYKKELLINKDGQEEEEEGPSHILSSKNSSVSSIDERISCVTAEGSKGDLGLSRIDSFVSTNDEVFENNNEEDDENENDGFDERMIRRDDFNDCPGSPSFRVYCTENDKNRGAYEEKFHLENGLVEESPNEEEEETQKVEAKTPKKGKRRKIFRNVIPSGGQIKNLLNVNSCTPRGKSTKSIS